MVIQEKLSLDEITIVPSATSTVNSRSECNIFDANGYYPLFAAPMNSVIDEHTITVYEKNKVYGILPRTVTLEGRLEWFEKGYWVAIGLNEIDTFAQIINVNSSIQYKLLIDVANGHMISTYEKIRDLKQKYGEKIVVMLGNIANPNTIDTACKYDVDYLRVGIGGGNGCITSSNTGIHYPMASLITETYSVREKLFETSSQASSLTKTKIIADGGMKNYSDIIKTLGLGADYVMAGTLFAKSEDAPIVGDLIIQDGKKFKKFMGMATKEAQRLMGKENLKTSEGVVKLIPVEYSLVQWLDNFKSYLQSAMSYTSCYNLDEFRGKIEFVKLNNMNIFNR